MKVEVYEEPEKNECDTVNISGKQVTKGSCWVLIKCVFLCYDLCLLSGYLLGLAQAKGWLFSESIAERRSELELM